MREREEDQEGARSTERQEDSKQKAHARGIQSRRNPKCRFPHSATEAVAAVGMTKRQERGQA